MPPALPIEKVLRKQMQRQLIQQAMELVRGHRRGMSLPRRCSHQACNPLKPCRVFYWCSHPFSVNRLSAKARDRQCTGVISCNVEHGKNTIWFCCGTMVW